MKTDNSPVEGMSGIVLYNDAHARQDLRRVPPLARFTDSSGQSKDVGEVKTGAVDERAGYGHTFRKRRDQNEYARGLPSKDPTSHGR